MQLIGVPRCAAQRDYEESVARVGGTPLILDWSDSPRTICDRVGGVLLAGGNDVDPNLYGEAPHATFTPSEPGRDEYELALVAEALRRDIPILAICRGVQLLNVARGGGLIQHIPTQVAAPLEHYVQGPPVAIAHDVWVTRGSRLHAALSLAGDDATLPVNSRHHQTVGHVGEGLIVTAVAPDGVIEAVELPGSRFCIGVQWHPENFWRTGEFRGLFAALVEACCPS